MKIHVLQLPGVETPGYISYWANLKGHDLSSTKLYENNFTLPKKSSIDVLIILGGPSQDDNSKIRERIVSEKKYIHDFILTGKKVLMICQDAEFRILSVGKFKQNAKTNLLSNPAVESPDQAEAEYWLQIIFDDTLRDFKWNRSTENNRTGHSCNFDEINNSRPFVEYDRKASGIKFHARILQKMSNINANDREHFELVGQYLKARTEVGNGLLQIFVQNELISEILTYFIPDEKMAA